MKIREKFNSIKNCIWGTSKKKDTEFSRFFREASSGEKKRVFKEVIRRATEDQRKILNETTKTV